MILEACQDEQQFLLILVAHNSTEWMTINKFY